MLHRASPAVSARPAARWPPSAQPSGRSWLRRCSPPPHVVDRELRYRPPARRAPSAAAATTPGNGGRGGGEQLEQLLAASATGALHAYDGAFVAKARAKVLGGAKASWELAWAGSEFASATATRAVSWAVGAVERDEAERRDALANTCWHLDITGRPLELELEDAECELLVHWVLTGWWAAAILTGTLTVAPESADAEAGHPTVLCLVLHGGRLSARLALLAGGGPLSPVWLEIGTAAGVERWEFEKWKEWPAGPRLPGRVTHRPAASGTNTFSVYSVEAVPRSQLRAAGGGSSSSGGSSDGDGNSSGSPFACPCASEPVPHSRVRFDPQASYEVVCMRGEGGHLLLEGAVGGTRRGWFILDTGTSGIVLDLPVAEELGLTRLGEHFTNGVGDSVQVGLATGSSLQVGPLTLEAPIFSVMALDGAIRRPVDGTRILGALGHDFLRECVVQVDSQRRMPGATQPGRLSVSIMPPGAHRPTPQMTLAWQRLRFMSKVPLVETGLCVEEMAEDAAPRLAAAQAGEEGAAGLLASRDSALFKLCLGVGGTGCVLGHGTAQQLRIFQRLLGLQPQGIISGAGGQQARLRSVDDVVTLRMTWVELQGMRFESVRALVHTHGDPPDLELGAYAAGLLASDLFRDCTLVLDYPARRFAAVPFADKD